ncbi:MAG: DinB family protein [Ignavibacteria bacterium]|nr:DinB family protein [Ignavibacteria bacterium]
MRKPSREMTLLLSILDEAYQKQAWHGPNLRGSIRGLSAKQAAWRPSPRRHNIWEIVLHCAYWKYAVRRRIFGEKRGSFPVKGSNWFVRPVTKTEKAWREEIRLLESCHRSMRDAIAQLNPSDLKRIPRGSEVSNARIVFGIAAHDLYHAGQIQLLKRLMK